MKGWDLGAPKLQPTQIPQKWKQTKHSFMLKCNKYVHEIVVRIHIKTLNFIFSSKALRKFSLLREFLHI